MQDSVIMKASLTSLDNNPTSSKAQTFEGFDFLRSIFAIAIVAYKTKIFNIPEILVENSWTYALSQYILSGMFGALAVPVFFQISLFLFYYKSTNSGINYFIRNRLPKLLSLYLFWVTAITAFDILFIGKFESIKQSISSVKSFLEFIVSGNSTPYFFFFSLIFLTTLAAIFNSLLSKQEASSTRSKISYLLLFISSALLFLASAIEAIANYTNFQSPYFKVITNIIHWDYHPLNFLPYIFASAITVQEYQDGKLNELTQWLKTKLVALFTLGLTFFLLEWILTSNRILIQVDQAPLDHYMRLSLLFASWLLLYLGILSKYQVPRLIKFISRYSLGIYGFHVFFIFKGAFRFDHLFVEAPLLGIIINFLLILCCSIGLSLVFRRIKWLKQFV